MNAIHPLNHFLLDVNKLELDSYPTIVQEVIQGTFDKVKELDRLDVFHAIYLHEEFNDLGMRAKEHKLRELAENHLVGELNESELNALDDEGKAKLIHALAMKLKEKYFFFPF